MSNRNPDAVGEVEARAVYGLFNAVRRLVTAALLGVALTAQAEPLLYFCDSEDDRVVIMSFSAESDDSDDGAYCDKSLLWKAKIPFEVYEPWEHVSMGPDDDHVASTSILHRSCKLKNTTYQVTFTPVLGNHNIQGRCGAASGAKVEVFNQQRRVASATFGDVGNCRDGDPLATWKLVVGAEEEPVIEQADIEENHFTDLASFGKWTGVPALALLEYKACKQGAGSLWKYAVGESDNNALDLLIAEAKRTKYWADALMVAVQARDGELLERLLAAGADPNVRPSFTTPLQEAVCSPGGEVFVDSLLRQGATNSIGDYGEDALFQAITCDKPAIVDKLLAHGAKLDMRNIQSILYRADDTALANAFSHLIKHGLDPNLKVISKQAKLRQFSGKDGSTVIEIGPDTPRTETVERSLLAMAKAYGRPKLMGVLIAAGAEEEFHR